MKLKQIISEDPKQTSFNKNYPGTNLIFMALMYGHLISSKAICLILTNPIHCPTHGQW